MKKLLLLLCTLLGTAGAWAQITSITDGGVYNIQFNKNSWYFSSTLKTTESNPGSFRFDNVGTDTYTIYSVEEEKYVTRGDSPTNGGTPTLSATLEDTDNFKWTVSTTVNDNNTDGTIWYIATLDKAFCLNGWTNTLSESNDVKFYSDATHDLAPLHLLPVPSTAQKEAYNTVQGWIPVIQSSNGLVTDGSYYTSNAKSSAEGTYAALVDGDYTTYFHGAYGSEGPDEDQYLQAELSEASDAIYFYFKKRSQNNNNRPTSITISGSNDGTTFTEITTINSGMPTDASVLDYTSDKVSLGASYKYVRFTVTATNTGAQNSSGHVFFTFSEFYIFPSNTNIDAAITAYKTYKDIAAYNLTDAQIADITAVNTALLSTIVNVTYELYDGTTPVNSITVEQNKNSEVSVPSSLQTDSYYYTYATEGTIGTNDCTIKVTRTLRSEIIYPITNLSNNKSYYIKTKNNARAALSTYTDEGTTYLASPVKSALEIEAKKFAILNYEDNYYLYCVDDQKFVTYSASQQAPLADMVTGTSDAIGFSATTTPLYEIRFDDSTSKIINSSANYTYGVVFNSWGASTDQWDDGCQYSIEEADDFDPTSALAALEAYFHPANYYDKVWAEVGSYLDVSTVGKPFGLTTAAATEIANTYATQLTNQQFSEKEYAGIVAIKDAGILYPEDGKYYLVKNTYNNKYLRVDSCKTTRGSVFADLTEEEAKHISAYIFVKYIDDKPYLLSTGNYFNWVYSNYNDYEAYTVGNRDKYAHFVSVAGGVGAFSLAFGNGEGDYADYLDSGFYALKNGTTTVAGSTNGSASEYAHWTFEEVETEDGDVNNNGTVDADDVTALVSIILDNTSKLNYAAGDMDKSGKVTLSDITTLVNKIKSAQQ